MYKVIKRLLDIIFSGIGLILFSPFWIIIVVLIKIDSKGSAIFLQERIGKDGKVFKIWKFRSMCVGAESMGSKQYSFQNDKRVTKVGKILRKTSIDEIPQLVNILKGDMSFVGPRPVLTYHPWPYDQYTEEQRKMFRVRPGITGWAQINGRKEVAWLDRIAMNIWYVENISLWLDIKILMITVVKVLRNENNVNTKLTVSDVEKNVK